MTTKQYAKRDALDLDRSGDYYLRHVLALTAEGLHRKSDIAAELAWRDREIDRLKAEAIPSGERPYRTDAEIVDQTVELTRFLLQWRWGLAPEDDHKPAWETESTQAKQCWEIACHIQELLTQTDVENAIQNLDSFPLQEGPK